MGAIIGRNREQLNDIEQNTGAKLKAGSKGKQDGALYVKGPIESQESYSKNKRNRGKSCQRYYLEIILKNNHKWIRHLEKIFFNSSELESNRSFWLSRSKKINRKPFSGLSQEIVNLLKINEEDTSPSFRSVRSPKP